MFQEFDCKNLQPLSKITLSHLKPLYLIPSLSLLNNNFFERVVTHRKQFFIRLRFFCLEIQTTDHNFTTFVF